MSEWLRPCRNGGPDPVSDVYDSLENKNINGVSKNVRGSYIALGDAANDIKLTKNIDN